MTRRSGCICRSRAVVCKMYFCGKPGPDLLRRVFALRLVTTMDPAVPPCSDSDPAKLVTAVSREAALKRIETEAAAANAAMNRDNLEAYKAFEAYEKALSPASRLAYEKAFLEFPVFDGGDLVPCDHWDSDSEQ